MQPHFLSDPTFFTTSSSELGSFPHQNNWELTITNMTQYAAGTLSSGNWISPQQKNKLPFQMWSICKKKHNKLMIKDVLGEAADSDWRNIFTSK